MAYALLRTKLDTGEKSLVMQPDNKDQTFTVNTYEIGVITVSGLNQVFEGVQTYELVEYTETEETAEPTEGETE